MTMNVIADVVNVNKRFGEVEVLRDVSLQVRPREVVCLLGPSGSGKSTLLRCINGLVMPDKGHVTVDGELIGRAVRRGRLRNLSDRMASKQREHIGMVFQHFNLFPHLTVAENLLLTPRLLRRADPKQLQERATALLHKVGLADRQQAFPAQLSGGEQQRVAIARALMMDPKLMLFDEPTSALDPELIGGVLDTMRSLAKDGMTMIVVTHEMSFARQIADRVAFLADGQILEEGTPTAFFDAPQTARARAFLGGK